MIQLQSATLQRGNKILFENASIALHHGWHVGIIGQNGAGKSSLFELLKGQFSVESGECKLPKDWRIAHMSQELSAQATPALEFVINGDTELRKIQADIAESELRNDETGLARLHIQLENIDGYRAESRAAKILHGLGFSQQQLSHPVSAFSGGWRVRLNLAQTLMCRSDLLLLDEPTNHLDLDAILWFEQWLKSYEGTLLLISHDREFLDQTIAHIIHLDQQQLTYYRGNYSAFEVARSERLSQQQSLYNKQQAEIAHIQSFIDRFKAKASKAKQAQGRIKALERLEKIAPAHIGSPFSFEFKQPDKLSDPLLKLEDGCLGYQQTTLIKNVNLQLKPGDRIGILGPNGAGKSTLIKTLAGDLPLISGETWQAAACKIGYFAQHQLEQLDLEASPLQLMTRLAPRTAELSLRNYLGSFGFHGDEVDKTASLFSGGEKSRLGLALMIWQKPNVLLLDEPTNHLDLEMRHALTMALQDFEGAVVLISHDRHLIKCATDVLFLAAEGEIKPFDGSLEQYSEWLSEHRKQIANNEGEQDSKENQSLTRNKKDDRKKAAERRQRLKPLRDQQKKAELAMERLTSEKDKLDKLLADNQLYEEKFKEKLIDLLAQQSTTQKQLEQAELDWMDASEQLDSLEQSEDKESAE
jgi:ATP-binding cassette subfamily F protein 3